MSAFTTQWVSRNSVVTAIIRNGKSMFPQSFSQLITKQSKKGKAVPLHAMEAVGGEEV
jgi:hypothetical protein